MPVSASLRALHQVLLRDLDGFLNSENLEGKMG